MTEHYVAESRARRVLADNLRQLIRIGAPYGLPRSPAELACRAGLPAVSLRKMVDNQGVRGPTLRHIKALANVYGLEPWEVIYPGWPDRYLLARVLVRRPGHSTGARRQEDV